eukprot:5092238-Amphidinium_carterae.1
MAVHYWQRVQPLRVLDQVGNTDVSGISSPQIAKCTAWSGNIHLWDTYCQGCSSVSMQVSEVTPAAWELHALLELAISKESCSHHTEEMGSLGESCFVSTSGTGAKVKWPSISIWHKHSKETMSWLLDLDS